MKRHLWTVAGVLALAGTLSAQIAFDVLPDPAKLPERLHLGEVAGVATTSKGNLLVYTRTGSTNATWGASRIFTHGGSRLFEFDRTGKFVREIGEGVYGFLFAQAVKVDPQDNIWIVDRGSNMAIKFTPEGRIALVLGRKPESVNAPAVGAAPGGRGGGDAPAGGRGGGGGRGGNNGAGVAGDNFNRPMDVAFGQSGAIYVADGMSNARIAKFDAGGAFLKSWGTRGSGEGQFEMPMSIAVDAKGSVYVADRGNKRIQVFDGDGTFQRQITNVGAPWALCISPGAHQFLYSSNSNDPNSMEGGEIYKLELDGTVVGSFGRAGKLPKEFGTVNAIDCRNPNELTVGEVGNWRVQRIKIGGAKLAHVRQVGPDLFPVFREAFAKARRE